jgi:hypothetical protein
MAHSPADRRRVYLACRAIFAGSNAQLRKLKKIRELVETRQVPLKPLIGDFGIPKVVEILRDLLDGRVFESELKAKVEFPELFVSTPERDVQRAESENHAAQSAAEALEEITSLDEAYDKLNQGDNEQSSGGMHEPEDVTPSRIKISCTGKCQ